MGDLVSMDAFSAARAKKDADVFKGEQRIIERVEKLLSDYNLRDLQGLLHGVTRLNDRLKKLGSPRRLRLKLVWTMDEREPQMQRRP